MATPFNRSLHSLTSALVYDCVLFFFQLGISAHTPAEFLAKAKEIVIKHKELESHANKLQLSVNTLECEQQKMVITQSHPRFLSQFIETKNQACKHVHIKNCPIL